MMSANGRISALTIISMVVVLFANSTVVHGADWPIYRGLQYNGITSETDWVADFPATGPRQLWKKSIGIGFLQ